MPRKKIYPESVYVETQEDEEMIEEIMDTYSASNFFNKYPKQDYEYEYDSDNYDGYSSY
jgi:hypothetical protein